jgi:DNA-binding MurR/RpiR family transcriptional regulator
MLLAFPLEDLPMPPREPALAPPATTESRLRAALPALTRAERQLAAHMLANFPVSVLGSVSAVARGAGVSAPTVVRLIHKLGYSGFPEFQAHLHEEVSEKLASPITKREKWAELPPEGHLLNAFAARVVENLTATLGGVDPAEFDLVAAKLSDPQRRVWTIGGRLTQSLSEYFATALLVMRGGVTLMSNLPNSWPPALLDMREGDLLLAFDVRRYEAAVLQVVEMAREQGAEVVLITDRWVSPAAAHATHIFPCHIEAPSAWDTLTSPMMLAEALLAAVQGQDWTTTEARLARVEELFARARLFRKMR